MCRVARCCSPFALSWLLLCGGHGLQKLPLSDLPWWRAQWASASKGLCLNKLDGAASSQDLVLPHLLVRGHGALADGWRRTWLDASGRSALRRCCSRWRSIWLQFSLADRGGEEGNGGRATTSQVLHRHLSVRCYEAASVRAQARHHRYLISLPPRVRGRSFGLDGEFVFSACCRRAFVALLERLWSSRTYSTWSFFSASRRKTSISMGNVGCGLLYAGVLRQISNLRCEALL